LIWLRPAKGKRLAKAPGPALGAFVLERHVPGGPWRQGFWLYGATPIKQQVHSASEILSSIIEGLFTYFYIYIAIHTDDLLPADMKTNGTVYLPQCYAAGLCGCDVY